MNLQSSGLDKDPRFLDWIKLLQKQRPNAKRNLDQFPATVDTLQKRVALLKRFVSQGPILFLGDFDLTALALGYHHPRTELTVIDIDQDLLNFISQAASTHDLPTNTIRHNFKNPLPREFRNYQTVFMDPPYTPVGIQYWLQRALETTIGTGRNKKRKSEQFLSRIRYLLAYAYSDTASARGWDVQKVIADLGLLIDEKFRFFNQYHKAKPSDLYILRPTPKLLAWKSHQ